MINVRIIATLAHVDVIIGVHRLLAPQLAAQDLNSTIANDLVYVHVTLSTASSLEDDKWEVIYQLARDHFVGSLVDSASDLRWHPIGDIHARSSLLQHAERLDQWWWEAFRGPTDVEVLQ